MKPSVRQPSDRAPKILARSIHKHLLESGMNGRDQLAVATALLGLIARQLRAS
jgi:hypothetical protein